MSESTGGNRKNGRFAPGESGNPAGRPKGARSKASILADQFFEQKVETIAEKIFERAGAGNVAAMRLCLDRAAPRPRDGIAFAMPDLQTEDDAIDAQLALVTAVAAGEVPPREAERMMGLLEKAQAKLRKRESDARWEQMQRKKAEAEAARAEAEARARTAAEAAARAEKQEATEPADPPSRAAAARSGNRPVQAGPLAFLDYPDPDGIGAGIREVMLKADPGLHRPYPPYYREKARRIGHRVPL